MDDCLHNNGWSKDLIQNLVEKVREGRIVPVIGSGAFEVKGYNSVQEYVIKSIIKKNIRKTNEQTIIDTYGYSGIKGMTILSDTFAKNDINLKVELRKFFGEKENWEQIEIRNEVLEFLNNGSFPLILTTCYFEILDKIITYNQTKYTTVQYRRDKSDDQDIPDNVERCPTVYHLFGNLSLTDTTYMVNETDLLLYIHSYLGPDAPNKLKNYLKSRYLLTLGCEIPDWTFRFMLYSLKDGMLKDEDAAINSFVGGAVATSGMDNDLSFFLNSIKYKSGDKITEVLQQISSVLTPQAKPSIFVSVNSKEYKKVGEEICRRLSRKFYVWLYPYEEAPQYWDKIENGIKKCDFFMPVVTNGAFTKLLMHDDISKIEKDKSAGLIVEWKMAADYKKVIGKRLYSVPFFLETDMDDFKNVLIKKEENKGKVLSPLFIPSEGAAALPITDLDILDADVVWKHLKLDKK